MNGTGVWAFARLELAESLRSKWAALATVLYLSMVAAFVWLGLRESTVLGFTGLSRVLLNVANAVIVVFPLVVLVGTHSAIVRAKTSGFFELMLTQPARRVEWFMGLLLARVAVLIGPLVLVMLGTGAAALFIEEEPGLAAVAARCMAITVSLVFSFIGVGLWVSSRARTVERAMVWALVAWVVTAALHDVLLIALLLRTTLPPEVVFLLAALNPSEAARVGLLTSVDPELSSLGPVGFWLANTLGPSVALALAVGWPALLGLLATWRAGRNLATADLVA
ncbi:ABC transporter permease [Archangium lansingense]|uniref:ABC transporter permease n=1 Tax=Archangium lansingense TaxID=2995310 RepID=UPI003B813CEA